MLPERTAGVIFGELPPADRPNRHVNEIIITAENCGVAILNLRPPLLNHEYKTMMVTRAMLDFSRFAIADATTQTPLTWFVAGMAAERQIPTLVLLSRTSLPSTDYLTALNRLPIKPVIYTDFEELTNHVLGFLSEVRQSRSFGRQMSELPTSFRNGDLEIDYDQREVYLRGKRTGFTPTEYRLLVRLSQSVGKFVPDQFLVEAAWGDGGDITLLKTHMSHMRRNLGEIRNPRYIVNRPGFGYKLSKIEQGTQQSGNGLAGEIIGNCMDYYEEFLRPLKAGEGGVVKLDLGENPEVVRGHLELAAMVLGRKIEFFKGGRKGDYFFEVK